MELNKQRPLEATARIEKTEVKRNLFAGFVSGPLNEVVKNKVMQRKQQLNRSSQDKGKSALSPSQLPSVSATPERRSQVFAWLESQQTVDVSVEQNLMYRRKEASKRKPSFREKTFELRLPSPRHSPEQGSNLLFQDKTIFLPSLLQTVTSTQSIYPAARNYRTEERPCLLGKEVLHVATDCYDVGEDVLHSTVGRWWT